MRYPFIKDGFECDEKVFHVVDPQRTDEYLQRLAAAGIDVITTRQGGQFELLTLRRKLGETSLVLSTVIGAKTGNIYKIYAESFKDQAHLDAIVSEAEEIVNSALNASDPSRGPEEG